MAKRSKQKKYINTKKSYQHIQVNANEYRKKTKWKKESTRPGSRPECGMFISALQGRHSTKWHRDAGRFPNVIRDRPLSLHLAIKHVNVFHFSIVIQHSITHKHDNQTAKQTQAMQAQTHDSTPLQCPRSELLIAHTHTHLPQSLYTQRTHF